MTSPYITQRRGRYTGPHKMLHTTLALLRKHNACGQKRADGSYCKLVASLPAGHADDAPITLLHVLESNGIIDAIWALRATVEPAGKGMACEMACLSAERVLPIFEKHHADDKRPREAIEAARAYGRGEITLKQLREKRAVAAYACDADAAACAYAADAYAYASAAAAYAAAAAADAYAAYAAADAADHAADAYAAYAAADAADHAAAYAAARKAEREAQAADFRNLLARF